MSTLITVTRLDGTEIEIAPKQIIRVLPYDGSGSTIELRAGETAVTEVVQEDPDDIQTLANAGESGGGGGDVVDPPGAPTISQIRDDGGPLGDGDTTSDNTLVFRIAFGSNAHPGDVVTLLTNHDPITFKTITYANPDDGYLEISPLALGDDVYTFTAKITNAIGASEESEVFNLTIDASTTMDSDSVTMDSDSITMDAA